MGEGVGYAIKQARERVMLVGEIQPMFSSVKERSPRYFKVVEMPYELQPGFEP